MYSPDNTEYNYQATPQASTSYPAPPLPPPSSAGNVYANYEPQTTRNYGFSPQWSMSTPSLPAYEFHANPTRPTANYGVEEAHQHYPSHLIASSPVAPSSCYPTSVAYFPSTPSPIPPPSLVSSPMSVTSGSSSDATYPSPLPSPPIVRQSSRPPQQHKKPAPVEKWTHRYEKQVFKSVDRSTFTPAQRRRIYISSLEAHIENMHRQLERVGIDPVPAASLHKYDGMTQKQGKMFIAGLQADVNKLQAELTKIQTENDRLREHLVARQQR